MRKIISLFQRNYETDRLVRDEIVPGAEWVVAGEGVATVKWDGTSCRVTIEPNGEHVLWRRYDAKAGKTPPPRFAEAQPPDPATGHWPGCVPCSRGNPADRWHFEAFDAPDDGTPLEGTYELCGPKIGNKGSGNPYGFMSHRLIPHGKVILATAPRTFDALRTYFIEHPAYEGIVWWRDQHDPECDKVKIKRRDFGLPWPSNPNR